MRKLLLLNWRDPWHPKAGGAEILTLRVCERLASFGWKVEWFSAEYSNAPARELRDGITYLRSGTQATVHLRAFLRYARTSEFDLIVDQVNTLPFYAMAYRLPMIAWFQQIAREVWLHEAPKLLAESAMLLSRSISHPIKMFRS